MRPKTQLFLRTGLVPILFSCCCAALGSTQIAAARELASSALAQHGTPPSRANVGLQAQSDRCEDKGATRGAAASGGCLTRPPGFWATHAELTTARLDTPLAVCGATLDTLDPGWTTSVIEALCVGERDGEILGPELSQLVRQCTAALLNLKVSSQLGGRCRSPRAHPYLDSLLETCCSADSLCTGQVKYRNDEELWTLSQCVVGLDWFNHAYPDSLNFPSAPAPANSSACSAAMNNGVVATPIP